MTDQTAPASGRQAPEPPWRSAPRRRANAPRPQLSREVVVEAALKVIEADGGDALTMRRVADQIGVSASSLYGYVANKEELVQLVLEEIVKEISLPPPDVDWQVMVKVYAREMLNAFRRHPGVAALSFGRVPWGANLLAGAERMLSVLRHAGIPDQVAAYLGDLGGLYVGAIAYELDLAPAGGEAEFVDQAKEWLRSLPREQFPTVVALADKMVAGSAEDRFEWGLDVIVRGLASYLTEPPSPEARWPQER